MMKQGKIKKAGRVLACAAAVALSFGLAGCSDSKEQGAGDAKAAAEQKADAQKGQTNGATQVKAPAAKKPAIELTTVLVRVNGEDITWKDLVRYTDMMAVLMKNRKKDCTPEDIRRFKAKFMQRFSSDMLQRKVMMTCLAPSNIVVSAAVRSAVERDFVRNYGGKGQKFEDVRGMLKDVGYLRDINQSLYSEMVIRQFLTTVCSNRYFVSDQEIKDVRRGMERRNQVAAATNKLQVARAEMVLDKIRKGGDFAALANEYSQDDERGTDPEEAKKEAAAGTNAVAAVEATGNGGDQGDCDESDFVNDKHVWQKLQRMKPGDVSELFEIEEGYAIYKLVGINSAEESNTGDKSLRLSRIFFRRAFEFPEQTDEELRGDLEREKRDELKGAVYRAFRKMSTVEYPDGHIRLR